MSLISYKEQRDVIPNWRSYTKTARLGELFSIKREQCEAPVFPISGYIEAWLDQQTLPFATDLLSAALVNGVNGNPIVSQAANFVLTNKGISEHIRKIAQSYIMSEVKNTFNKKIDPALMLDNLFNNEERVKDAIRLIKRENSHFPYNPIAYCELARYYTLLGVRAHAEKAMNVALHLAPNLRYVTRCAARLFLQLGDAEHAHWIVTQNSAIKVDPWLLASEIAINSSLGRNSRFAKIGIRLLQSKNYAPFCCSELASALGTLEMSNGSRKKCIKLVNSSLQSPNDNSLAQAEWLKSEHSDLNLDFRDYSNLLLKSEADARYSFFRREYHQALIESIKWIDDLPYDKTPILFGSSVAHTFLKDFDVAAKILRVGLISNPGDTMLLNNLAYVLALKGETAQAESIMDKPFMFDNALELRSLICHTATVGLIAFRKGEIEKGINKYLAAINLAKEQCEDKDILYRATLNFLREALIAKVCSINDALAIIDNINTPDREILQLKMDVKQQAIIAKDREQATHPLFQLPYI